MELLLLSLCLVSLSGSTFADGNGSVIIKVKGGSEVTLPCYINKDIESERFQWKKDGKEEVYMYDAGPLSGQDKEFIGRVSHFADELKKGNASITIRDTKVSDTGVYTCYFPKFHQTFTVRLVVGGDLKDRSSELEDACRKPHVTLLQATEDGVLLECEVSDASPGFKLNISWFDSSGNKLIEKISNTESGKTYILQTTVKKSDTYRCVATMEELSHQVYFKTYVHVPGSNIPLIIGSVVGTVLALIVAVAVFMYKRR